MGREAGSELVAIEALSATKWNNLSTVGRPAEGTKTPLSGTRAWKPLSRQRRQRWSGDNDLPAARRSRQEHRCRPSDQLCSVSADKMPSSSVDTRRPTARVGALVFPFRTVFTVATAALLIPSPFSLGNNAHWQGVQVATAAPCYADGEEAYIKELFVDNSSEYNLTSIFACEDGVFDVAWSGSVTLWDGIQIGSGTTVRITGNYVNELQGTSDYDTSDGSSMLMNGTGSRGSMSEVIAGAPFGSLFMLVDGASLSLNFMALRDARAEGLLPIDTSGAGVHAQDSVVTLYGCELDNLFAEFWGGGIFANRSRVEVRQTVFRGCMAGETATAGQVIDPIGVGGAVGVDLSSLLVSHSKIEDCYASKKGGGIQVAHGNVTLSNSEFLRNRAGSVSVRGEDPWGEGGDFSASICENGYNETNGACLVNDCTFNSSYTGKKGGSLQLSRDTQGSRIDINRSFWYNITCGKPFEDDPQGEGGTISISADVTVTVNNSAIIGSAAGKKGGAITMSSPDDDVWDSAGGKAILINSTFESCQAEEHGGVVYLNAYATLYVKGNLNRFVNNLSAQRGGVVSGTSNSLVEVEGGLFSHNHVYDDGGVFWTKGMIHILGGDFLSNSADDRSGVWRLSEEGSAVVEGGNFEDNWAFNAGVGFVDDLSELTISGGRFARNEASEGGVIDVNRNGNLTIEGGLFTGNIANSGGFLYKKGGGITTCKGAIIEKQEAVYGGGIFVLEGAVLDWQCDLIMNEALSGPAIYALDGVDLTLRNMRLFNNTIARGSVIFMADSDLKMHKVDFHDPEGSAGLSAIQADGTSNLTAEATVFRGFVGEAVVYNQGNTIMDYCDFGGSGADFLVDTSPGAIIRNTAMSNRNYASAVALASEAEVIPNVDSLIDVELSCEDESSLCSPGSSCIVGDLGVYCECFYGGYSGDEICASDEVEGLDLVLVDHDSEVYYSDFIEAHLNLSFSAENASDAIGFGGDMGAGMVWKALASSNSRLVNWTVFPSNGMLFPGDHISLYVYGIVDDRFDGEDVLTVSVHSLASYSEETDKATSSSFSAPASVHATDAVGVGSSSQSVPSTSREQSMDFSFYHCSESLFWDVEAAECEVCTEANVVGDVNGLDCSEPGASTLNMALNKGYWRAETVELYVRQCLNEDACIGGKLVNGPDDLCDHGYEGPYCAICQKGFGRGIANSCHECTAGFKGGMYFLLTLAGVLIAIFLSLLVIYLVAGSAALDRTIAPTRKSVRMLRQRTSEMLPALIAVTSKTVSDSSTQPSGSWSRSRSRHIQDSGHDDPSLSSRMGNDIQPKGVAKTGTRESLREVVRDTRMPPSGNIVGFRNRGVSIHPVNIAEENVVVPCRQESNVEKVGTEHEEAEAANVAEDKVIGATPSINADAKTFSPTVPACDTTRASTIEECKGISKAGAGGEVFAARPKAPISATNIGGTSSNPSVLNQDNLRALASVESETRGGAMMTKARLSNNYRRERESRRECQTQNQSREHGWVSSSAAATAQESSTRSFLSRLKIVIVVWQITSASAEITQTTFPSVYRRFLETISVFTFDLGWLFSAGCLAFKINFYHQLIILTAGPIVVLMFLCITFCIGSRRCAASDVKRRGLSMDLSEQEYAVRRVPPPPPSLLRSSVNRQSSLASSIEDGGITGTRINEDGNGVGGINEQLRSAFTAEKSPSNKTGEQNRPSARQKHSLEGFFNIPKSASVARSSVISRRNSMAGSERGSLALDESARSVPQMLRAGPGTGIDPHQNDLWWLFSRHTTVILVVLHLVYTPISTVVFRTFWCSHLEEIDKYYLWTDFRVECYTPEHHAAMVYSVIMIVIYPLGIPATFWYYLNRQKSHINPPVKKDDDPRDLEDAPHVQERKMRKRRLDETVAPTAFLWAAYLPNRYYFEVVECMRRLLSTGLLVFMGRVAAVRVAMSCVLAFISFLVFDLLHPHADKLDLQLYRTGCLVVFFSNFLALMIEVEVTRTEGTNAQIYAVILIILNVLFFLSIWWNTFARIYSTIKARRIQDLFMSSS